MDHHFEPADLTAAIAAERSRALEKTAKGTRDEFDYNRGVAEGLRIAGVAAQAYFDTIFGSESHE